MRAQGIDISKWQTKYDPMVKAHDYIILKASEAYSEDSRLTQHYASAEGKLVIGAYHFYRSWADWKRQADVFLETIHDKQMMIAALDMEGSQVYKSGFGDGAEKWMEYVKANTTAKTISYTGRAAHQYLTQVGNDWLMDYPLWLAQYPYIGWDDYLLKAYTGEAHPSMPAGRTDWVFWQFSAGGNRKGNENGIPGWRTSVDLNVFNGTREEFGKWLRGEEPPVSVPPVIIPPVTTPVTEPDLTKATYNLALREGIAALQSLIKE